MKSEVKTGGPMLTLRIITPDVIMLYEYQIQVIDLLIHAFTFGAAGFLIGYILTRKGEVLSWWPGVVQWLTRTRKKSPGDWNAVQWFFAKILYGCPKCITGQLAFWWSVITDLDAGNGFILVTLSIFTSVAIEKHYG